MFSICGFFGLQQMRDARLRTGEGAAHIDLMHQIKPFQRSSQGAGEANRTGIIDQDVNAAKGLHRLRHGGLDLILEPDVHRARQRFPTRRFHLRRGRMDGAGQLRMRLSRLGRNDNIGAVPRRAEPDRFANPPAGTGDEYGLSFQLVIPHVLMASS